MKLKKIISLGGSIFLFVANVYAQAPNISYSPSSNSYQVGVAITNWTPTNTGGTINSASSSASVSGPSGMGINPTNSDVYVTQYGGASVTYYNTSLTLQGTLGSGYTNPDGVVFDSSGNAYVVDAGAAAVYKITPAGIKTTFVGAGLNTPYGIGIDASNNIYVTNYNGSVKKYSPTGVLSLTITSNVSQPVDVKVDASGNIYILNQGTNNVTKYNSAGTYQSVFANGFNGPWALAVDASNNIYVGDSGNNVVDIYNSAGVLQTTKSVTNPEGLAVDAGGDLFVSSYSANKIVEFPANNGYTISPTLPAGLSFDSTTGTISGTPSASSSATVYTVVGSNSSGSSTTYITITCYSGIVDWKGTNNTNWNQGNNWSGGAVPSSTTLARIGVNNAYTLTRTPVVNTSVTVGSIQMGESGSLAPAIQVASGITLTDNGLITYQSDANSASKNYTAILLGPGTITAQGIAVNANNAVGTTYTQTLISTITTLNLSGNIDLTSTYSGGIAYNATFNVAGVAANSATVALAGEVISSNGTGSTSTLNVLGTTNQGILQLSGSAALGGFATAGTNVVSFNGANATIQYSGTSAQTVYTSAAITGLSTGVSYTNISFSGSAIKTALSGNLTVSGSFTNSLTINDATDYIDLSSPTVNFNGAAQSIAAGNGTGTTFYNVQFSGSGTKTLASGSAYVADIGVLTMSGGSATLATGGFLTLNSDATGSATVAQIPTGNSISGSVNVQRYITGGTGYRGYRLGSSPVSAATVGSNKVYSINYLENSMYLTGSTGTGGGFDKGGNPTIYLYREDQIPSNATFTSGNFWGISTINNPTAYNYYLNGGSTVYNIPIGGGYMFFFRGNRAAAALGTETLTSYTAAPTATMSTAGTLNQGQVVAADWYTPTTTALGYTGSGAGGNAAVRGFNLMGNPYASSIDWSTFSATVTTAPIYGPNVGPTIWTFDAFNKNYATYNAVTGIATGTGGKIIASGQGFFVQALATGTPTLTFQESAKTSTQPTTLLMARRIAAILPTTRSAYSSYIRLKLIADTADYSDAVVGFNPSSSTVFNRAEDTQFLPGMGNSEAISAISSDDVKAAVKWVPLPKNNDNLTIPFHVFGLTTGQYTIAKTELTQVPALYEMWLMDRYKKDSLDIRANSTYVFNIDATDTTSYGDNRFQLVIRQNPALRVHLLDFSALKVENNSQVVWLTENEENYTGFSVQRSIDGGETFNTLDNLTSNGAGNYRFLDKTPHNGANLYRLQITDLNGNISYSNVATVMFGDAANLVKTGIAVYPNPAQSKLNLNIAGGFNTGQQYASLSTANNSYNVEIANMLGVVLVKTSTNQQNWQTDVSNLLPGTYVISVTNKKDNSAVGQATFVKL